MRRDKYMLYVNGCHYVRRSNEDGRFYTCDKEGIAKGEDLEHVGDDYATLEEAKKMVDFWAGGGHWMDRPDR